MNTITTVEKEILQDAFNEKLEIIEKMEKLKQPFPIETVLTELKRTKYCNKITDLQEIQDSANASTVVYKRSVVLELDSDVLDIIPGEKNNQPRKSTESTYDNIVRHLVKDALDAQQKAFGKKFRDAIVDDLENDAAFLKVANDFCFEIDSIDMMGVGPVIEPITLQPMIRLVGRVKYRILVI